MLKIVRRMEWCYITILRKFLKPVFLRFQKNIWSNFWIWEQFQEDGAFFAKVLAGMQLSGVAGPQKNYLQKLFFAL